ncbi:amino acid adenylation domain-containing protein [Streptomyces sp. NPDC059398]|uniref:amino acid adenylation domain-containing protein n=1 Tax=Streptomyces sp. NPDC059398 TaxID=3346820 RepID=UPI0036C3449F
METQTHPTVRAAAAPLHEPALFDLLRREADAHPGATALEHPGGRLTRRGLVGAAEALGHRLARLGAGADVTVGLYAEPSADLVIGVWGILASGGAYLPLSPEYPEERLRFMVRDSGTRLLVTQSHLADRARALAGPQATVIVLDGPAGERPAGPSAAGETAAPLSAARPQDLAYVIYTSGSTGRPKGVMIEHRAVVSQLTWLRSTGHLGPDVRILQKTPMSFDAAQWEILAPAVGGAVVAGLPNVYRDPDALVALVREHGVTTLQCVPTLLQALLETDGFTGCASLRRVFCGGEALTTALAGEFAAALPGVSLVNLYGPTECTINATAHVVASGPPESGAPATTVPIGTPVDGVTAFVLDDQGRPVDIGEKGELHLGGAQVARGYLNLPEQTAQRFVRSALSPDGPLYRTGDLVSWNPDGTLQFSGRIDSQVKLRGYRVELEEVASAVEEHTWVRRAAAVVTSAPGTGWQTLVACVELNPREAALMDQGNHGSHHQSKASRLQVRAQLSHPGVRTDEELAGLPAVALPGAQGSAAQRAEVFARKTYRFHDGTEPVTRDDLVRLLSPSADPAPAPAADPAPAPAPSPSAATTATSAPAPAARGLDLDSLGELLRWFGPFHSEERLLPKYAYASPGALYATQIHLETDGSRGLGAGLYYFHPARHALVRFADAPGGGACGTRVHLLGRRAAIAAVYSNNIDEVLEFEAGHLLGVLDRVLPAYGLAVRPAGLDTAFPALVGAAADDHYMGAFDLVPATAGAGTPAADLAVDLFVQAHGDRVAGLAEGTYRYSGGELHPISADVVRRRDVIAINQGVYGTASFGISAVSREERPWLRYVVLGRLLHHLQCNGLRLGLMSSGYSSRSGNPLPAALRLDDLLAGAGIAPGPSYFFIGGRVSDEQLTSQGMREDSVHMRGPTEMIRDDLVRLLPDYMIPDRVQVVDALPLTANGKVDMAALAASDAVRDAGAPGEPHVAPATDTERRLAALWGAALKYPDVSMADTFFARGGNSLVAVTLTHRVNREFGTALPLQALFECPRLSDLAARVVQDSPAPSSRLLPLHDNGAGKPVFCWPGLGGYPMNLRTLAADSAAGGPFYGIQAAGINEGERPFATIGEMAAADIAEIRAVQPEGPYTLWGYSFGARVAFEAAWQLERDGHKVDEVLLICPGNPTVELAEGERYSREASLTNPVYTAVLLSVFLGRIGGPELAECLRTVRDEEGFVAFVHGAVPALDPGVIRRITRIVAATYEFDYTFAELLERRLTAPVTVFKASGDDYSFIEGHSGYSATPPTVVELTGDHYQVLREKGVAELVAAIGSR